jgi:hypothetical protein
VHEGRIRHAWSYVQEVTDNKAQPSVPELVQIRVFCHILVDQLSQAGLREAIETLAAIYDFHRVSTPCPAALAPAPTRQPVRMGKSYERPSFSVVEE